jgi:hypothetical protein
MADGHFTDESLPRCVDDTETALFEGEAVVFRASTRAIHRLNATAGAVWVCCDGDTTVATMIDELAGVFGVGAAEARPQVLQALDQLAELGLLAGVDSPPKVTVRLEDERASDGSRIVSCPPDT